MTTKSNNSKIFYGWFVVFGALILMTCIAGIAWNCAGLFIKPVCEAMGFTRQQMGVNNTLISLMGMGIGLGWGKMQSKVSLKKLMRICALLIPLPYLGYSMAPNLYVFYACSALLGFCQPFLTTFILSLIIANWFEEKRGLAYGIAFMGSGLGGMIFNPVAAWLIESYGWRMAYRSLAGIMFAAAFIAVFFLVRPKPEEMGLRPLGWEKKKAPPTEGGAPAEAEGMLLRDMQKTVRFWIAIAAICLGNTAVGAINQTLVPRLTDSGYTAQAAAWIISVCMGIVAIGKMTLGQVYDRIGTRKATLMATTCGLIGLISMLWCRNPIALAAILFLGQATAGSMGTVGTPLIAMSLFGKRDYAAAYGFMSACSGIIGAASPMINGAIFDNTGSYDLAYISWAVVLTLAIMAYWKLLPKDR